MKRVQVGNQQRIRHQRARAGAPARPHRAAVFLGPLDEVRHDQKVAREPHFQDGVQLELQPLQVAGALCLAFGLFGVEVNQPPFQPLVRHVAEVVFHRHHHAIDRRNGEVGQLRLAQHQREVAAAGNFDRVGQCGGHVGKQYLHLGCAFQVLLACEAAHTAGVGQDFAFRDAHAGLVGLVIVGLQKLCRVGGHHGQTQPRGQRHGGQYQRLVVRAASALQLQEEAVHTHACGLQGHVGGAALVPSLQRLPHRAGGGTAEHDQPLVQFGQPVPRQHGLVALDIARPATGQQLAQVQVALLVLHQQQHAGKALGSGRNRHLRLTRQRGGGATQPLHKHLGTQHGFDARTTGLFVKLDGPEHVGQVGEGHGGLGVGRSGTDGLVDAQGAVND